MAALTITKFNFEEEVLKSDKVVLVDFWASWCGPCKMVAPIVEQIADEHPEIKVCKVNVDEEMELAQKYRVMSIPTLVIFKGGEVSEQSVGFRTKEQILEMI